MTIQKALCCIILGTMKLMSPAFQEGESIPQKYTCQGEDINPSLHIEGIPSGTKTLALIVDDPDVPAWVRPDQMWVHWVLFNISPNSRIDENTAPGSQGLNTAGDAIYMGPCPPDREHRYFFKLYALDTELDLQTPTKEELLKAMEGHILEETALMGRYEKR